MLRFFRPAMPVFFLAFVMALTSCNNSPFSEYDQARRDTLADYINHGIGSLQKTDSNRGQKHALDSIKPVIWATGDPYLEYVYYRQLAWCYFGLEKTDSSFHYCHEALRMARAAGNHPKDIAQVKRILSACYVKTHRLDSALFYAKDMYYYAKKNHDTALLPKATQDLSTVYGQMNDIPMFGKYALEAYPLVKDAPDRSFLCNNIMAYYLAIGRGDLAEFFYHEIKKDTALSILAYGNYGEILIKEKKYEEAIDFERQIGELCRENHMPVAPMYQSIADIYRYKLAYRKAEAYYDTAVRVSIEEGKTPYADIRNIAVCAFEEGDYKRAATMYDSAYNMYCRHIATAFGVQNRELEKKYDIQAREAEISKLELINTAAGKQARLQRYLIAALGIMMVLGAVIFYQNYRRRKLRFEKEKAEALHEKIQLEQRLLRTQMEPHFIFNTLSQLQALIRSHENDKAEEYMSRFARLLRSSLEHSRESFVLIGEEIAALEDYLSLQMLRFSDTFNYTMHMYVGYENDTIAIPPMLLQPFVENALLHGMRELPYKGHIDIRISKNKGTLHCIIEDNGHGMSSTTKNNKRKKSLSTIITQERLDALGATTSLPASLDIYDKQAPATGTVVEMIIPYVTQD